MKTEHLVSSIVTEISKPCKERNVQMEVYLKTVMQLLRIVFYSLRKAILYEIGSKPKMVSKEVPLIIIVLKTYYLVNELPFSVFLFGHIGYKYSPKEILVVQKLLRQLLMLIYLFCIYLVQVQTFHVVFLRRPDEVEKKSNRYLK